MVVGALAQLARASRWQCEGHRFDSDMLHGGRDKVDREIGKYGLSHFETYVLISNYSTYLLITLYSLSPYHLLPSLHSIPLDEIAECLLVRFPNRDHHIANLNITFVNNVDCFKGYNERVVNPYEFFSGQLIFQYF